MQYLKRFLCSLFLLIVFIISSLDSFGQGTHLVNRWEAYFLDRAETRSGRLSPLVHTSLKPYHNKWAVEYYESLVDSTDVGISWHQEKLGWRNRFWTQEPSDFLSQKAFLKYFYTHPTDFFSVDEKNFSLSLNPIIHFAYTYEQDQEENTYINTRGITMQGLIGQKLGFYFLLTENQAKHPAYITSKISKEDAVPGEGRFQYFKGRNGVDYFSKWGYISFPIIPEIQLQFGHGKHFIGNGVRSLLLSDFSNAYLYFKINTQVWRFNYQNLFTEWTSQFDKQGDGLLEKKYAAIHHLSLNATRWWNIGIFEAVVFSRENGYDFQYLNPLIFYRSIEHDQGSPDNILIGMDTKINFGRHFSAYGQLLFDEFSFFNLIDNKGWWANKYGIQAGLKYFDVAGINDLFALVEFNRVRPYTYSHDNVQNNFTHYNQAVAHPLGANFREILAQLQYFPRRDLQLNIQLLYAEKGISQDSSNYGGNIFLSNTSRIRNEGVELLQGNLQKIQLATFSLSYEWRHNLYLDADVTYRKEELPNQGQLPVLEKKEAVIVQLGMRWNLAKPSWLF